ncbi:MAG TPA: hypothetical protein VIT20_10445 [Propionibacteriaceae bacterium]
MNTQLLYSASQHATWALLFERQVAALRDRAHPSYFEGLAAFEFTSDIPDFIELRERIEFAVGWTIARVDGQVDGLTFNSMLRDQTLPTTTYVRGHDELQHSKEPDMFHDMFGHLPWLIDEGYRAFLSGFGAASLALMGDGDEHAAGRLGLAFKWSIEYGLVRYQGQTLACGAGLMSSAQELKHALGPRSRWRTYEPAVVVETQHVPAQLQTQYFVLTSLGQLGEQLDEMVRCARAFGPESRVARA